MRAVVWSIGSNVLYYQYGMELIFLDFIMFVVFLAMDIWEISGRGRR